MRKLTTALLLAAAFILCNTEAQASVVPPTHRVPDAGASALLLGTALAGCRSFFRKKD